MRKQPPSTPEEVNVVLNNGLYAQWKELRLAIYRNPEDNASRIALQTFYNRYPRYYLVCNRIYNNSNARGRRLFDRIADYIESGGKCYFVTLTFSDYYLLTSCYETRRQNVRRFLKSICERYVANKDFGSVNDREHYHAVISGVYDKADVALIHDSIGAHAVLPGWRFGFSNWETIGNDTTDARKVSKYIAKLQNHAVKQTASKDRMIYSRRKL